MSYASLDELRSHLGGGPRAADDPAYRAKMMHPFPEATSVDRVAFILKHCEGKRVLEFGASGLLHEAIVKAAAEYMGVDREDRDGSHVYGFDLDDVSQAHVPDPFGWTPEILICGETLEHLSNPGWFLTRLRRDYPGVPLIITVPNAFSAAGQHWLTKGIECVNKDHCAWYSPKTLAVLLQRAGYTVGGLFWYGGTGPTAEGLVVVTE